MWDVDLVAKAMFRHRSIFALLALELAVGFTLIFTLMQTSGWYLERAYIDPGHDLDALVAVTVQTPAPGGDRADSTREITARRHTWQAALARIPGVQTLVATDARPDERPRRYPEPFRVGAAGDGGAGPTVMANAVVAGPEVGAVLGLRLLEGRDLSTAPLPAPGAAERPVLITRSLRHALFGQRAAVGASITAVGEVTGRVWGVVEDVLLVQPFVPSSKDAVIWLGEPADERETRFLLRVERSLRGRVAAEVLGVVGAEGPDIHVTAAPVDRESFRQIRTTHGIVTMVFIAAVLVGLAGLIATLAVGAFLVVQRTHQIGIQRALGAGRGDIIRYFVVESLLITTVGTLLGLGISAVFFATAGVVFPGLTIDAHNVLFTAGILYANGLLAAFLPARRAARIAPSVASRTS